MDAVVAVYSDWGIGDGQTQPVVLHADRKHFRELTAGAAVIVGRKTLEDFPGGRPLPGRRNIVVSRRELDIPGAEIAHSIEDAVAMGKGSDNCFVIGGAGVFKQSLPFLDRVYITKIDLAPFSSAFFENLDASAEWTCVEESAEQEENGIKYRFCTYERIS